MPRTIYNDEQRRAWRTYSSATGDEPCITMTWFQRQQLTKWWWTTPQHARLRTKHQTWFIINIIQLTQHTATDASISLQHLVFSQFLNTTLHWMMTAVLPADYQHLTLNTVMLCYKVIMRSAKTARHTQTLYSPMYTWPISPGPPQGIPDRLLVLARARISTSDVLMDVQQTTVTCFNSNQINYRKSRLIALSPPPTSYRHQRVYTFTQVCVMVNGH